ncbi:phage antirepressor KilAC domain-containing protein [Klebsiella grimontii]|uniref:phage antirepressor KilAC domain-containing protein n=1 Tax=Klebsiella oxytoca TaxID=571 RepID=UPI0007CCE1E7|nr:phage regulatory protein/antirepressor Ant [Klebsiella oxytoca]SAP68269.1 Roi protein [Klebsiella oxytoca]HCD5813913.1 phage regulatory protein/antirepressor Ant [Klebsiella oxytoca]HDS6520226.1 phage regulatory protein/antirepressor Ant [Klebsiella oxytoca]HDT4989899.1 phage regulatory protein/antirepressor Ant [Klebsiella oxytoca]
MAQWINNLPVSSAVSVPTCSVSNVTMSSREIAELTEKQHGHVCRDIETMLKQLGESPEGYIQLWTHPQNGQRYREYRLDREHTECLITGYSAVLRMKIIRRLREMEDNANAIPQTLPEALRLAADMAEQNARLSHKVQQDAPKVAFVNQYVEAGGAKSLRETAKILNMPEKAMIDTLLRDKVLFRQSGNLFPHALRQREGLFTVKTGTSDYGHAYTQTRVTPRGVQWIAQRYASELMGG